MSKVTHLASKREVLDNMLRTNLIKARGDRTQTELAELLGVKQQTVSHWELGRATPPIDKMLQIERLLKVPKEVLFYDIFNSNGEYLAPINTGTEA